MSPNPQETYRLKKCRIALPPYWITTFLSHYLVPGAKQEMVLSSLVAAPTAFDNSIKNIDSLLIRLDTAYPILFSWHTTFTQYSRDWD